jgi:chromosome segregation protein
MHVIVGQGQLDAVLHASPEDRRGFIEEAAGILKHRRRKEKTIRKLDAMQANLTRLSDLAGEIRRQLKPLGQQAEIAKEAASIASIVRDARARLLADEVVDLRSTINNFSRNESERKTQRIILQEQLDHNKLREARLEQAQVGGDVDDARRVSFGLESVQERLRSLYTLANQRLSLLGQQSDGPTSGTTVSQALVDEVTANADELGAGVHDAEKAVGAAAATTATAKAALDSLDEEISAQSALVSRHELESAGLTARVEVATSTLTAAYGELARQQQALAEAQSRRAAAQSDFEALEVEAAHSTTESDGSLDSAYEAAEAKVASTQADIESLRDALHALERERDALAARTSALSLAVDQKDGSSALVAAKLSGIRGLVAEHVKITPGFEAAIAAALGTLADAVLADNRDAAIDALAESASRDFGRVEVVVADAEMSLVSLGAAAGTVPATDVVTAPNGVNGLLAHVLIADDLEVARAAYNSLANAADITFVTRQGDVLTQFVLRGGSGAKRSRLELVAERDVAAQKLGVVTTQIERTSFDLEEKRRQLTSAKADTEVALTTLREYDAQLAAQSELLGRHRIQADAAQAECDRLGRAVDVATEAVTDATAEVSRAQSAADEYQSAPRPILDVSERDPMLAEVDAARAREVEQRILLETIRERVRAERVRAEQLAAQLVREREAAAEQARLAVIRQRQIASATRVVEMLPAVLDSADRSLSEARVVLAAKEAERSAQNQELSAVRVEESALRERLSAVSESVHGLEMQIYEKKLHLSSLLERSGDELGLIEDVLVAEYGPHVAVPDDTIAEGSDGDSDGDSDSDSAHDSDKDDVAANEPGASGRRFVRAEQEVRLQKAERKLARLGRVNPLALEEFEALEQRHKFLTEQLTDLTNTRKDLLTIIDELDEKMQAIFSSAFEDTKNAFNDVFPVLFPGGTGSIFLTNPDDLLTSGIEVTVKPAGKKIERLSLLSGGERSLAAVALLIAIFKARPSPFYIMDEVEAALDDANLGRLLAIFEDLRKTSQLIVITHQKRTMEIADALYGVSMRADGISAVVGQRVVKESAVN